MRAVYFAVFLLAGCKTLHTLDVQQHQEAASAATTETHETKESGPEHIVMTVEEYEQLCPGPENGSTSVVPPGTVPFGAPLLSPNSLESGPKRNMAAPAILVKRTVTVTDRGPSLDDLRSLSSLQSKVNTAIQVKKKDEGGPAGLLGLLGGLWPVILIGGAILAFVLLKPGWVGLAWRFVAGAAKAAFGKKAP